MSSSDRIPFYIQSPQGVRVATEEELANFKSSPKNKAVVTKWTKANRLAEAQHWMELGHDKNVAWAKAFDRYPDVDQKPRFFIK